MLVASGLQVKTRGVFFQIQTNFPDIISPKLAAPFQSGTSDSETVHRKALALATEWD